MRPAKSPEERAADDLLDRLDDLYDQRPDARERLVSTIDHHVANLTESDIGPLAVGARMKLMSLDPALEEHEANQLALAGTNDLRLACAARASGT